MLPLDYNRDDPDGVRLDVLVDGRISAQYVASMAENAAVGLDGVATEPTVSNGDRYKIRDAQKLLRKVAEHQEENVEDIDDELEAVRESLGLE